MAIRHKNKVGYFIFFFQSQNPAPLPCSLLQTQYRMTSQFRNFPRTCHTITQITFASLPPHSSSSREFPEVSLTPKIPLQFESPKTSLFRGLRPGLYFSSKSEQSRPLQIEPRNLSTGLNLDLKKKIVTMPM